jgi:hypothetical protein
MFQNAILDSVHFITAKFQTYIFSLFFNKTTEIPNSMGMGHVPKILEKIPE